MTDSDFVRSNEFILARAEKRTLVFIAQQLPGWVSPDLLTAIGVLGGIIVFASYLATRGGSAGFLWLASFGLVVHWLGDSLDGTVARTRQIERPRYGYVLDQNVDVLTNLLICGGIGISPYARLDAALLAVAGYHMIAIFVAVRNVIAREFTISVCYIGPTELRVAIILINTGLFFFGAPQHSFHGIGYTWVDCLLWLAALGFMVVFVWNVSVYSAKLRRLDDLELASRAKPERPRGTSEPERFIVNGLESQGSGGNRQGSGGI